MRSFGVRLPILAATAWASIGLSVMGRDLGYSETVYLTPTVTTVAVPTSYVSSRSYLVPTAYIPTAYSFGSYIPASFVDEPFTLASTRYVTTGYQLRRGLLGRLRIVEQPVIASATTYVPSSYFLPTYYTTSYRATSYTPTTYRSTVYEYPRVWASSYTTRSSSDCEPVPCDTPVLAAGYGRSAVVSSESAAAPTYTVPRSSNNGTKSGANGPVDDRTIPSTVGSQNEEAEDLNPVKEPSKPAPSVKRADSPPTPPAAQREQNTGQPIQPAPTTPASGTQTPAKAAPANAKPAPPVAPLDKDPADLEPAPIDNTGSTRRDTLRPTYSTVRTVRTQLRNILIGRVESDDSREPLGDVSIAVERADNRTIRRTGLTDAFGGFAIRLTDGEWNVNVRMPSGRFYQVRTVTVSNGAVIDKAEQREVQNLIISY
jgi:hypothetical protein